jgi:hypothetical protein
MATSAISVSESWRSRLGLHVDKPLALVAGRSRAGGGNPTGGVPFAQRARQRLWRGATFWRLLARRSASFLSTRIERWSPSPHIESRNVESRRGGRAAISCLRHTPLAASRREFLRLRAGLSRVS